MLLSAFIEKEEALCSSGSWKRRKFSTAYLDGIVVLTLGVGCYCRICMQGFLRPPRSDAVLQFHAFCVSQNAFRGLGRLEVFIDEKSILFGIIAIW